RSSRKCRHTGLCQSCCRWLSQHDTTTSGGPEPWTAYAIRTPSDERQKRICCSTVAATRRELAEPDGSAWTTISSPSYDRASSVHAGAGASTSVCAMYFPHRFGMRPALRGRGDQVSIVLACHGRLVAGMAEFPSFWHAKGAM